MRAWKLTIRVTKREYENGAVNSRRRPSWSIRHPFRRSRRGTVERWNEVRRATRNAISNMKHMSQSHNYPVICVWSEINGKLSEIGNFPAKAKAKSSLYKLWTQLTIEWVSNLFLFCFLFSRNENLRYRPVFLFIVRSYFKTVLNINVL